MTFVRKYGLSIATILSVGLLTLAANLSSPHPARFWLLISGWSLLAWCISIWSCHVPESSPYKGGCIFVFVFGFFSFIVTRGWSWSSLFDLVFEPSGGHLYSFLTSKTFLASAAIYFAAVCVLYAGQLRELKEDLQSYRERLQWSVDDKDKLQRSKEVSKQEHPSSPEH